MKNILYELYYGNIQPLEKEKEQQKTYSDLVDKVEDLETKLLSALDTNEEELYKQLSLAINERNFVETSTAFVEGFCLGAKIMHACYTESGEQ